jgi:hypothetical protein
MDGQEQFECLNCLHVGALNQRGGCERCGSQVVMSVERIMVLADTARRAEEREDERRLEIERKRLRALINIDDRYVIEAAGFWLGRFNPSANQAEDAA